MEFHEKLQELRKHRGLTQEELAKDLYVSRTAISKWESGRGYPSIDLLKEISIYFSVSIDDLLSGDKLLSIAQKENKANIQNLCDMLWGIIDVFAVMLIVLPLYPNQLDDFVYSVNLFEYSQTTDFNRMVYWMLYGSMIVVGITKIVLAKYKVVKKYTWITTLSLLLSIAAVMFLALAREAYAIVVTFALLMIKGIVLIKYNKTEG